MSFITAIGVAVGLILLIVAWEIIIPVLILAAIIWLFVNYPVITFTAIVVFMIVVFIFAMLLSLMDKLDESNRRYEERKRKNDERL